VSNLAMNRAVLAKILVLGLSVTPLLACQSVQLPALADSRPALTEDDYQVMKAVLDQKLRRDHERSNEILSRGGVTLPKNKLLSLVFESTTPSCGTEYDRVAVRFVRLPPCLNPYALETVGQRGMERLSAVAERGARHLATAAGDDRHTHSLRIGGPLGDNVDYIPWGVRIDSTLIGKYPPPVQVVSFSAPVYLENGTAVIFFHVRGHAGGFVHLARTVIGWSIVDSVEWIE
jgi:hypothetical protein